MKKAVSICSAICFVLSLVLIPSFAYTYYGGASVTVIHNGYNYTWDPNPSMPLAVVQITTSASINHRSWTAIYIPSIMSDWVEAVGSVGLTSGNTQTKLAYGYPSDLQTDYGSVYP